ncbi:hypothetical protein EL800_03960 [Lactiplantibacillus plantarum]|jgi:hypothetical protein|nr:hypothetical protein ASV54_16705 [Lactiplantibacillus plantarum]MBG1237262.1 hypothetical protein [Lactiplantibacillus plantarum subsp. plantarum]MBP5835066.1 hypothetical protein [Lactiplantibacillus plantarum]MCT1243134.1 hypothetical protein [Lactiplantibacillus plantarum]MCT3221820.1 hypothetical protein [Lactiplantibacillus plantarum]
MDKTNSHSFLANTFRLLLSAAAYNMVLALKKTVYLRKNGTINSQHSVGLPFTSLRLSAPYPALHPKTK